jgi:hypothetical protein
MQQPVCDIDRQPSTKVVILSGLEVDVIRWFACMTWHAVWRGEQFRTQSEA